jgi:biotin operon repressor
MPYERVREIEQRFQKTIELLAQNSLNARQLASTLGISRPTAQRMISEFKRRGYKIRSVHDDHGWHYELINE